MQPKTRRLPPQCFTFGMMFLCCFHQTQCFLFRPKSSDLDLSVRRGFFQSASCVWPPANCRRAAMFLPYTPVLFSICLMADSWTCVRYKKYCLHNALHAMPKRFNEDKSSIPLESSSGHTHIYTSHTPADKLYGDRCGEPSKPDKMMNIQDN